MTALEFGPAHYRIVYADGFSTGNEFTMPHLLEYLAERRSRPTAVRATHGPPARVEPVDGTQYRGAYDGLAGAWHDFNGAYDVLLAYVCACSPVSRLELRSPVQP